MKVLFVCTGNTCRSPMAELFFNHYRKKIGKTPCGKSCGISTCDDLPISGNAAAVMLENGIDSSGFRSSSATLEAISEADVIYTMSSHHRNALVSALPEFAGKISLLMENRDVSDPFGGNIDIYRRTFDMMRGKLIEIAEKLS